MFRFARTAVLVCCLSAPRAGGWHEAFGDESLPPVKAATRVDTLLREDVLSKASAADIAPICDDATFVRRVSLDLVGQLPTPGELTAFVFDSAPDKRSKLVDRLVDDPRFGRNWGRYWRDTILARRAEDRALLAHDALEEFLAEGFNANTPWDEIAGAFIAAYGDVREEGSTALILAQMAEATDVAAEVSRIFMGVQIQCAQCHDHPTDRWTREQFHEFAAFFPRIAVVPKRPPNSGLPLGVAPSFEIRATDFAPPQLLARAGKKPEHHMPDLSDPSLPGEAMTPGFFATGQRLRVGASDFERRNALAEWLTSRENPWFAKAFVNRLWAELVGEGLYEPIDDLGPDKTCSAPAVMEFLSAEFARSYDVKSLFRTIAATAAYQRECRPRRNAEQIPFTANVPQRLRGDQVFDILTTVLGVRPEAPRGYSAPGPAPFLGGANRAKMTFNQTFAFDTSARRDEVVGSIPQALMLMNTELARQAINARSSATPLGRMLAAIDDDEDIVLELWLRTLGREPTDDEMTTSLAHIRSTGDRATAFEDLQWALINRTEFMYRY